MQNILSFGTSGRMTNHSKMAVVGKEPSAERPCDVRSNKLTNHKQDLFYYSQPELSLIYEHRQLANGKKTGTGSEA